MKISLQTVGSRGDVQPFVALGLGLTARGHDVTVCAPVYYRTFIERHGLGYAYLNDGVLPFLDRELITRDGASDLSLARVAARQMLDECWAAARDADLVVYHPRTLAGPHLQERLGIPAVMAVLTPALAPASTWSRAAAAVVGTITQGLNLGNLLLTRWDSKFFADVITEWRQHILKLPPAQLDGFHDPDGRPCPVLHAYSPAVVPEPPGWPDCWEATGYWFLPRSRYWEPPEDLSTFLAAKDTPVYLGFGNLPGRHRDELAEIALEAVRQAKVRAVLGTGWGKLDFVDRPECICPAQGVPHDWLFPKVAAVVHHGGAGTTAAGLLAGRPALVCNTFGDAGFWGQRVHDLGLGPAPIAHRRLKAEVLAEVLKDLVALPQYRDAAISLRTRIQAEDGVTRAVELVERCLGKGSGPLAQASRSRSHRQVNAAPGSLC